MNDSLRIILSGLLICTLLFSCAGVVSANTAVGQVSVTSLSMEPAVLMPSDTAVVTVTVRNSGSVSVPIGATQIMGVNEIYSSNDKAYNSVGNLGPGDVMTFTFPIKSNGAIGTFYPTFYMDFLGGGLGSLKYTFPVQVDNTQLSVALINQPDAFGQSRNEKVTVRVGNPRANALNGIQIMVSGDGVSAKQTTYFVGKLEPDQYVDAELTVVVDKPTDLSFDVHYRNGQNIHTNSVQIPVELGERKVKAEMVLNNIVVTNKGTYMQVTGDVNNAGLEDAKSVTITTSRATPAEPYKSYVVGALEPDGLAEFDVTFSHPEGNTIDLIVDYKDADGNPYQEIVEVTVTAGSTSSADAASDDSPIGLILGIVVILLLGACVFVVWRKGIFDDIKRKQ